MKVNEPAESRRAPSGPDPGAVQRMFAAIAPRYDLLNHLLSASIDRRWRRLTVNRVRQLMVDSRDPVCLDLCCGTGDLALEIHRCLSLPVIGSDFCHPMLTRSNSKIAEAGLLGAVRTVEADSMVLPFRDATFSVATIAFGLRNLQDPGVGLSEIRRVLRPAGCLVVLEFSRPVIPVFREVFNFYFRNILPRLGAAISGQGAAYRYLHDSVQRFPSQLELVAMMREAGFTSVGYRNLSGGIAALHWGVRALDGKPGE